MIDHFWPELFEMGFVHILRTPVVIVTLKDKSELEFFTERDFQIWKSKDGEKLKNWNSKYYKGLSTWKTSQFAKFLTHPEKYLFKVSMDDKLDKDAIDLAFNGQRADDRKVWLETPAAKFEDFIKKV